MVFFQGGDDHEPDESGKSFFETKNRVLYHHWHGNYLVYGQHIGFPILLDFPGLVRHGPGSKNKGR